MAGTEYEETFVGANAKPRFEEGLYEEVRTYPPTLPTGPADVLAVSRSNELALQAAAAPSEKKSNALKWLILAFVATTVLFAGMLAVAFVMIMSPRLASSRTEPEDNGKFEQWTRAINATLEENSREIQKLRSELGQSTQVIDNDVICPKGPPGNPGEDGPQGPMGNSGPSGSPGAVGAQGPIGSSGPPGSPGAVGPQGPIGSSGSPGSPGAVGPQGPIGNSGPPGSPGEAGPQGPIGNSGTPGSPGAIGPQGPIGISEPSEKVNYTAIQEMIRKQIEDDFDQWMRDVNATLEENNREKQKLSGEIGNNSQTTNESIYDWPRTSCSDVSQSNILSWDGKGGIVQISRGEKLYEIYCDVTTDGGGWTTFQRRKDGSVDFYRTWEEYAGGFGNKLGEFWLGLENIYQLTQDGAYELRVDLTDWDGSTAYAKYGTFSISGRSDNYRLTVGQYSGTAGDSMANQNGYPFSAKNKDLDGYGGNCASMIGGAWWYYSCAYSSLNGRYSDTSDKHSGVLWFTWRNKWHYSLKGSEMKFRKK